MILVLPEEYKNYKIITSKFVDKPYVIDETKMTGPKDLSLTPEQYNIMNFIGIPLHELEDNKNED